MRIRLLASAAALATLTGCDAGPNFDTPAPPDLVPLAVGNEWVMEGTRIYAERPGIPPREDVPLGIDTLRVVGDTLIDGERWFDVRRVQGTGFDCHGGWYANREGSLYSWSPPAGAIMRAPTGPFTPASIVERQYDFEVRRTLLPEPGQIAVGGETLSTRRVEFAPLRYFAEDLPGIETIDETVREVDQYVPGIGFAVSECSYMSIHPDGDAFTLAIVDRYVLRDYTLVGE